MAKKLYITTAIPYVNGRPHIGNSLDYLLADIWARYQRQNGQDVRFQIGTDEHGNKIAAKAAEQNLTPQAFVDQSYISFETLAKKIGTSYTDFVRTSDLHHKAAVQFIWQKLQPFIYKSTYEGWYCQGCEQFYTDKEAADSNGVCPNHQQPLERISEQNYFLKASHFSEQIFKAIQTNRLKIVPQFRKKEFLEFIKDGLNDVSISRPAKSLSWGIPVPGDPSQVMYVWLDALTNYITVIGYPDQTDWQEYWPADVQVIGKDILRFHAGIWPAILMALDLPLPKQLLVHGFVNADGQKMSKTIGNVIDPNQIIDTYGVDAFRYYFSRHIPTLDDGDFSWQKFETVYNNELANDLGNLVQRVSAMIKRYQAGVIGDSRQTEHDTKKYHDAMKSLEFDKAIDEIWVSVRSLNKYIEAVKPWEVAKRRNQDPEAESHLSDILSHCVGVLLQIGDLLAPFLPSTAQYIHNSFESGVVNSQATVLFPKIYAHTPDPRAAKQSNVN